MAVYPAAPRSVAIAANTFVLSRSPGSLVSLADGIIAVHQLVAFCEHTDAELAELLATLAIRQGRNVSFDAAERARHSKAAPARPASEARVRVEFTKAFR